ncbi:MAG TPA: glycosyltransferase [Candidatus Omnitrophota bacterium]|nr:glycosyltransferase [Candidatus Omnitrophota bacterium]
METMLHKSPLVSVIIPTYNRAMFIVEAVKSVLNQTFKDYELIIVDDGSKDKTKEILEPYKAQIRYVYQNNKGHASARNTGIRMAVGKYIAFNDSDDILLPNTLEILVDFMQRVNDVGLTFVDMEVFEGDKIVNPSFLSNKTHLRRIPFLPYPNKARLLNQNSFNEQIKEYFIPSPGTMIRKEVFEQVGLFDESLFNQADRDMWFRISRNYKIAYINDILVRCRQHGGNFRVNTEFIIKSHIQLFLKVIGTYVGISNKTRNIILKKLSLEYYELGYYYYSRQQMKLARSAFLTSLHYDANNLKSGLYYTLTYLHPGILEKIKRFRKLYVTPH